VTCYIIKVVNLSYFFFSSNLIMHNLIFIGNIGVGKITLICNILNFLLDYKPALDVGAGRTTVCDVEIKKTADYDSMNHIHVEGYSLQEFQGLLSRFFYEPGKLPSELVIALSNMIKFQEWKKTNEVHRNNAYLYS